MVSYVDGVGIRTIKPVGGKVAFATFDIVAHKVDAVEANVEPLAVGRDDLWPEGGLVFVLGEAREYRADLDDVGDDDAVAEGMLLETYLAHVFVDGLEDAKETFQQTGVICAVAPVGWTVQGFIKKTESEGSNDVE